MYLLTVGNNGIDLMSLHLFMASLYIIRKIWTMKTA
jgi:hypothetical protein